MAEIVMQQTRLLGFAPRTGAAELHAAMSAVSGPDLHMQYGPAVVALFQQEPGVPVVARGREELVASLRLVQRRLEVGCAAGPFLPMDPAAACCSAGAVARLLETTWDRLAEALAGHGARQQWDIVLRWDPEPVVARHRAEIAPAAARGPEALAEAVGTVLRTERGRREAALLDVLRPAVVAFAEGGPAGSDGEVAVTVLVANGAEAAVEAAIDGLAPEYAEGASIDMRGPLPPVSFSAVRVATLKPPAITAAWATLGLPERVDLTTLHRHWRLGAAAIHPDRQRANQVTDATVAELTAAYRLLRDLVPPAGQQTLDDLLRQAGPRLVLPADVAKPAPVPERVPALAVLS
jgi:hypothetical protein